MATERKGTTYNKLIGKTEDGYAFLNDVFEYSDNFKGATGTVLCPISEEEYEERTDRDSLIDRFEDIWKECVYAGKTTLGLEDWVDEVIRIDGAEETAFDTSYWRGQMWDDIREKTGQTEKEYPVYECTNVGRIFSKNMNWEELYEPELWKLIQEYETEE
jgi:hypothetical protein